MERDSEIDQEIHKCYIETPPRLVSSAASKPKSRASLLSSAGLNMPNPITVVHKFGGRRHPPPAVPPSVRTWGAWDCDPTQQGRSPTQHHAYGQTFPWAFDMEEKAYVLEGSATLTADDPHKHGGPVTIVPGDRVTFPKGWRGTWKVHSFLRKVYAFFDREGLRVDEDEDDDDEEEEAAAAAAVAAAAVAAVASVAVASAPAGGDGRGAGEGEGEGEGEGGGPTHSTTSTSTSEASSTRGASIDTDSKLQPPQQQQQPAAKKKRRVDCTRCTRPTSVCICASLPAAPLDSIATTVILLTHPAELKQKMRTGLVSQLCFGDRVRILVGRKFGKDNGDGYPELHAWLTRAPERCLVLVADDPTAMPLGDVNLASLVGGGESWDGGEGAGGGVNSSSSGGAGSSSSSSGGGGSGSGEDTCTAGGAGEKDTGTCTIADKGFCLLAIDATWKYAKEMLRANAELLKSTTKVILHSTASKPSPEGGQEGKDTGKGGTGDEGGEGGKGGEKGATGSEYQGLFVIRKPPAPHCVSTHEAIVEALCTLEPDLVPQHRAALLEPLHAIVRMQLSRMDKAKCRPGKAFIPGLYDAASQSASNGGRGDGVGEGNGGGGGCGGGGGGSGGKCGSGEQEGAAALKTSGKRKAAPGAFAGDD